MPTVLILGGRAPVALDHARRFAAQGWRAMIADSIACRGSGWSRAVQASIRVPEPRTEPRAFAQALAGAVSEHGVDLLVPTCEEVFYVSRYRSLLPAQLAVATDAFEKLRALHSKLEFLQLAGGCNARIPESRGITNLAQAREWARGRAVVLKPEYSRFGVHVRLYPDGIPERAAELPHHGRWVAQEYCKGEELCSYSVAVEGRLTAHVAYRPLYRLSRSSSYYFDPAQVPAIQSFVERFVHRMRYTGQISFDWIRCEDGQFAVLECNPRAVSGVHLFERQARLPDAFLGSVTAPVEPSAAQARMIAAVMLTSGMISSARAGHLARWWSDYSRARDVLAEPGDARPLLGNLVDIGSHVKRALQRRCSVREATTRDIEWDGESLPEC